MAEPRAFSWFPTFGEFGVEQDGTIVFNGRAISSSATEPVSAEAPPAALMGLLLSNQTLADGEVRAEVTFDTVTAESICEFAIPYDANAKHLLTVGLGGDPTQMCSIREYGSPRAPGMFWVHRSTGDRTWLRAGATYCIEASFNGDVVSLRVDGVQVASVSASTPTGARRQVGLLCRGLYRTSVRNFQITPTKPKAFIVMQFGAHFDDIHKHVVEELCKEYDVKQLRADEVTGPGLIIADIVREISTSQLVIADITPINANVYFEVGYAFALGKPTILLAKKGTPLPFDVAGFRVLFYEDSIGGKVKLEEALRKHLESILDLPGRAR